MAEGGGKGWKGVTMGGKWVVRGDKVERETMGQDIGAKGEESCVWKESTLTRWEGNLRGLG